MALQKIPIDISFAQGLDQKTDPLRVPPGKFLLLENSIYNKIGRWEKRNGFPQLTSLPDNTNTFVTTFNGNLTALGESLLALSESTFQWVNKAPITPIDLSVKTLVRSNLNQIQCDSVSALGLTCTVFTDSDGTNQFYKYVIADTVTTQNIIPPTEIPVSLGTVSGAPRVFVLGNYFVIVFNNDIAGNDTLQYVAISINDPEVVTSEVTISSNYTPSPEGNFDGFVANNNLYLAWNGDDVGGAIRSAYITSTLQGSSVKVFSGSTATIMSVSADLTLPSPNIYFSYYDSVSQIGEVIVIDAIQNTVLAPTQWITATPVLNVTSSASNGAVDIIYEVENAYSYDPAIFTNYIESVNVTSNGVVGTPFVIRRSVGLASKSFIYNEQVYFLSVYDSDFQPTYFLIDLSGNIIAKLAYSNAGGYVTMGLPSVTINDNEVQISYLYKALIESANKAQGVLAPAGVYAQLGINEVTFTFTSEHLTTSEIANTLNISGGITQSYDGFSLNEQGFHLYPDSVEVTTSGAGGLITAQDYFYVATYEWQDNQGNIFRSAPSIPVKITTTGATSSNTVNVPTLRLTEKITNPVKIVIYRWSTGQQVYYQVTSISMPLLNDLAVDDVSFVDTQADSAILGNEILYTSGGVVENIGAPAFSALNLYKSRMVGILSEDPNVLWYSKQVVQGTPVEFSDLFTIYVSPTTGAQGDTGPSKGLAPLDDKLIIFKDNAIYYIVGNGPDNTGAQNDFSDPIFVTATVGCSNPNSIVFMPQGLMFQSDKGIWLLGRDLSTTYIGAPVENFNNDRVLSSLNIPGTNQVRFTLESGVTLMYDYFFGQWGTFTGIPGLSSTLYEDLHTFIDQYGRVFQERPGTYLDGSNPVNRKIKFPWISPSGLQGLERIYFLYLIGEYLSPHKMVIDVSYDYSESPTQSTTITPDNFAGVYGSDPIYGNNTYGGSLRLEQWQLFFQRQKCQSFQITLTEFYDPSYGVPAGAGFTLSGIKFIAGSKGDTPELAARLSVG